jgi:hypothetical protein
LLYSLYKNGDIDFRELLEEHLGNYGVAVEKYSKYRIKSIIRVK